LLLPEPLLSKALRLARISWLRG